MKRLLSLSLALLLVLTSLASTGALSSYALGVGDEASVTSVKFIKQHKGFDVTGGNIIIIGTGLDDINVLFEVEGGIPKTLGTKHPDSSAFFLNYQLNFEEADSFTGKIYIGNQVIDLNTPNFPNIVSSDSAIVNQDLNQALKINGSKLNLINNSDITGTYGRGIQQNNITTSAPVDQQSNYIRFTPTAPGPLGYQDITLTQKKISDPAIEVTYYYQNAFRILQDMALAPVEMYPNAASKGDTITLTSDKFSDSKNYAVYFLNLTDNDFAFSDDKKSPAVSLSADKKRLSVQVPNNNTIALGSKRVVVVDVVNNEIIARYNLAETFNLIDAAFQPSVTRINPDKGTDEGAKVQLIGRNLLNPVIPELNTTTGKIDIVKALPANGNREMVIDYDEASLTFKGVAVTTLSRKIRTIIGKQTFYELKSDFTIKYAKIGADDYLYIATDVIDDAAKNPVRDVIVEIDTEIVDANGKTFRFSQAAVVKDGFTFEPSSIEPSITAVIPEKVQINQTFNPKETTLVAIEGKDFLVNKYTDSAGKIHTNYPVVQIQITDTLGDGDYIVKFDKNDTRATAQGTITDGSGVLANTPVDLTVLNADNQVVDGSVGNDLGTKIILYIPKTVSVATGGKKNIQVINPKRNSENLGSGDVALDIVDFVIAGDTPVIESVDPNIVTADSEAEVVIVGSNFQDGVKVYIDGVDVGNVKREVSTQGNNVTLTFKAPKGRVGKTQLQVINPLGGIAVRDFYYVRSFNQDPSIVELLPNKGTVDTLVIIKGDNFFKPDAAAESTRGLDGFRLIGSRVLFDGKDINDYNVDSLGNVEFVPYTAPAEQPLFVLQANQLVLSPFYNNATVLSADGKAVYRASLGADGNPQIGDGNDVLYRFSYSADKGYQAFDDSGELVGSFTVDATSIKVNGGQTLTVQMNNQLVGASYTLDKELKAVLADYWPSIILRDDTSGEYYTLQTLVDGSLRLSNGKFNVFDIKATGSSILTPALKAFDKTSNAYDVAVNATGLTVNTATPLNLKMLTPYTYNSTTRQIIGNRVQVMTKGQLRIRVPNLVSSTGYKTVTVLNPDTKSATLKDSFYYYKLPATKPIISMITPNMGSISGGYVVTISGRDFNDSSQVYFDGNLVPPSDKSVNLTGTEMSVKVPEYPFDITEVYGVGELTVPVVLVNSDGGSAQIADGFTYVKPTSTPKIKEVILPGGSTNGGEVVELIGDDFRFFEPYENIAGGVGYDEGLDTYNNVNGHLDVAVKWDDLLKNRYDGDVDLWEKKPMPGGATYFGYNYYYDSPILPRIFFGSKQARIVDFANGYIKVITPPNTAGAKNVIVMNNDAGVSNTMTYNYKASTPTVTYINPASGARVGGEMREIIGKGFAKNTARAYQDNDASTLVDATKKVQTLVRFADISNTDVTIGSVGDGRINANRSSVTLDGGLKVSYDGNAKTISMSLQEAGATYNRVFSNYTSGEVFVPVGMLKKGDDYYQPTGYGHKPTDEYNDNNDYEWIKVNVDPKAKRLFVTRGFAPSVQFVNSGQLVIKTPSYYTVDTVPVTIYNPDGGLAKATFTYTNPASSPIIESVKPADILPKNSVENSSDTDQFMVQASIQGGVNIEISGRGFRDGVKVYLGTQEASVEDVITDKETGKQVIIAKVPAAQAALIGNKLPIIIENSDGGIANSTDKDTLGQDKRLIYFIYRKPLSLPTIKEIVPSKTSQHGGNSVEIRGTDFRAGAQVIIGSVGGVPVKPTEIEKEGRYIRFTVPKSLTPGEKDIQVINSDYGTVTLERGLTIVSYPTVENRIYNADNQPLKQVVTEGGQVIIIKGENFADGAKVIFGGERKKMAEGITGDSGYYKDDQTYVIVGGTAAPKVEFVDGNTLKVTTPKMAGEGEYIMTVINKDTGISNSLVKIAYGVPVPGAPTTLKVAVVDNRYIKLYDYQTKATKHYELFVYVGGRSIAELMKNQYRDFQSLGTTTFSPYKITRLNDIEDMSSREKAYFVVKAVNQYGSSEFSNIAHLTYKDVYKVEAIGAPVSASATADDRNVRAEHVGDQLKVDIPDRATIGNRVFDYTSGQYSTLQSMHITMSDAMVSGNSATFTLKSPFIDVSLSPANLNNRNFIINNTASREYVTFNVDWRSNALTARLVSELPRQVVAVSPTIALTSSIANNTGQRDLGDLAGNATLSINLSANKIKQTAANYTVYYYNGGWQTVSSRHDRANNRLIVDVSGMGYYVVTKNY